MRVTRPRTAPIEPATRSRVRIGTIVVACAAAPARSTARVAPLRMRLNRGPGRDLIAGEPSLRRTEPRIDSELRERQRLLFVVHHRDHAPAGLRVLADADVGDRFALLERQERLVFALRLLKRRTPAVLLHLVFVQLEDLWRVALGAEHDAVGLVGKRLRGQYLGPLGDGDALGEVVRHADLFLGGGRRTRRSLWLDCWWRDLPGRHILGGALGNFARRDHRPKA